ncbi:MAG: hypothetical protein HYY84_01275 [Deltaproteobacteria bacterium]|nr:hypothetical protein [Deltaproteobacteria bacterium]
MPALIVSHHNAAHRRAFFAALLFDVLVFLPMGAYFLLAAPDWSFMYFVPASDLSTPLIPAVLALYPIATVLGFIVTARIARRFGRLASIAPAALALIAIAAFSLIGGRLFRVGLYAHFHAALPLPHLFESSLLPGLVTCGVVLTAAWIVFLRYLLVICKATPRG